MWTPKNKDKYSMQPLLVPFSCFLSASCCMADQPLVTAGWGSNPKVFTFQVKWKFLSLSKLLSSAALEQTYIFILQQWEDQRECLWTWRAAEAVAMATEVFSSLWRGHVWHRWAQFNISNKHLCICMSSVRRFPLLPGGILSSPWQRAAQPCTLSWSFLLRLPWVCSQASQGILFFNHSSFNSVSTVTTCRVTEGMEERKSWPWRASILLFFYFIGLHFVPLLE